MYGQKIVGWQRWYLSFSSPNGSKLTVFLRVVNDQNTEQRTQNFKAIGKAGKENTTPRERFFAQIQGARGRLQSPQLLQAVCGSGAGVCAGSALEKSGAP